MSYTDECKRRCKWCAERRSVHWNGFHYDPLPQFCTAPTIEQYVADLESQVAALREAGAKLLAELGAVDAVLQLRIDELRAALSAKEPARA